MHLSAGTSGLPWEESSILKYMLARSMYFNVCWIMCQTPLHSIT